MHTASVILPVVLPMQIPTGEVADVAGSAFDLTKPTLLGERLGAVDGGGEPGCVSQALRLAVHQRLCYSGVAGLIIVSPESHTVTGAPIWNYHQLLPCKTLCLAGK
jgi:hypothetical protein